MGPLRVDGAEVVELFGFALALLQGLPGQLGKLGAELAGGMVLGELFGLQFFTLGVQGLVFGFGLLAGRACLLPLQVQRLQGFGRFAVGEFL